MLIDSHCHLDYPDFAEEGVSQIIARAKERGVGKMMTISTQIANFDKVLTVANLSPDVFCTVGTHPHHASEEAEIALSIGQIVELTKNPKVVGIGECGLDYYYDFAKKPDQHQVFANHIEAGLQTDLPLVIHTRDAEEDTIKLLRDVGKGKSRGVIHCFTGTQWLADQSLDIGYYISFSGILTFKKSEELRQVAASVPLDRLLVETDSPYLAPMPYRGKRNEPSYVVHTAEVLAQVKGVSPREIAQITAENYYRLFNKAKPA